VVDSFQRAVDKVGGVFGDTQKPRAAAEQTRGQRTLDRIGRAEERDASRDGRRGEPVIGQCNQHRFEHHQLLGRRAALGDQPVGKLAEADLAKQFGGQVVAQQGDRVEIRGTQAGAIGGAGSVMWCSWVRGAMGQGCGAVSHARISSVCSPSSGGGDS
jgi:hypothetical protein